MGLRKYIPTLHSNASLELAPTPFAIGSDDPNDLWEEGVKLFFGWLCANFKPDIEYGDFEIAEKLDVHRMIADEWLLSVIRSCGVLDLVKEYAAEVECHVFVIPSSVHKARSVAIRTGKLKDYDPWTNRDLDQELPDAIFADLYIDKYYDVFINEHFIMKGKVRIRGNKKAFTPLSMFNHPRYADGCNHNGPALIEWRAVIDKEASS